MSAVPPTAFAAEYFNDNLLMDLSFSTGGGAWVITEARWFEVWLFADYFNSSASSNPKEGMAAGIYTADGFGNTGDVSRNLNSYSSTCFYYSSPSYSARVVVSGQGLH